MRVAVLSEFRPGYLAALEASYERAFRDQGHTVECMATSPGLISFGNLPGTLTRGWPARLRQGAFRAKVAGFRPDLVVIVKGVGVSGRSVRHWRASGTRVVNVFPDNPFEAMRTAPGGHALLEQFRACDLVYVHDRFAAGQLQQLGAVADFIAFARDPLLQDRPGPGLDGVVPPIVFVGSPDPERIRYLRAVADLGLGLWGPWESARLDPSDPLAACIRGKSIIGEDMVRCLGRAKLSINILRQSQKAAHNMRTFESPGCGACTVSERTNGVLELMEDGREVATFSSPPELREVCLRLLANDSERLAMAEAGWRRVREDTYARRASQILAALGFPCSQP